MLVPLLRASGDEHVDLLMLSHRDLDHVGGAKAVLGALAVDALSGSPKSGHPIPRRPKEVSRCDAGQRWSWDGVDFVVLRPAVGDCAQTRKSNAI